jgi:hypothetical protein
VLYVDSDPVAIAHSQLLLAGEKDAAIIQADLREPEGILAHETTRRMIDFDQPVGVILAAVLHFVTDTTRASQVIATLTANLAPGSHLLISHVTSDGNPQVSTAIETVYNRNVTTDITPRSTAEIRGFFDGMELLRPGVVKLPYWRPDPPGLPANADRIWGFLAGVARKP